MKENEEIPLEVIKNGVLFRLKSWDMESRMAIMAGLGYAAGYWQIDKAGNAIHLYSISYGSTKEEAEIKAYTNIMKTT